ncbi:hypothetical protein L198_00647 [Cryptococcus wingfieldii CBS 7118]|uniref:Uncharacterized protein n=1 Tax=Cryptococcus wingfieldii CBS 7118 TaxID=1295528 RepID=A0A1E3K6T5_9TREE|nr:hypothetical protein L198_00647 [Cryptococcus wingfieldii CBS 7118]ODO08908.1 hypothetical protein L198_00647 [Cryptococcus wingfieldii CBS 7118]
MQHTNPYNSHILPTFHTAKPDPTSPTSPNFPQYSPFAAPPEDAPPSFPSSTDNDQHPLRHRTLPGHQRHLSIEPVRKEEPGHSVYDQKEDIEDVVERVKAMDVGVCMAAVAMDAVAVVGFVLVWILVSQGKSSRTTRLCIALPYSLLSTCYILSRRKHNANDLSDLSRVMWHYGEDAVKGNAMKEGLGMLSWIILSGFWALWFAVGMGLVGWCWYGVDIYGDFLGAVCSKLPIF